MRLTLRTMLAYMDDILEPADHQDIGHKIEESEFATNLLHRIREVARQPRITAPKVSGRGMGLDPNTVAEYLDNVLSGERVPDFEKVCLESDVHLAEVAACHQILSLVLGEPAEVDSALRQRMYEIVARSQEAGIAGVDEPEEVAAPPRTDLEPAGSGIAAALSSAHADRAAPKRDKLEVPDYLRTERRSRFWPVAVTALLVLLMLGAVDLALFGWDNNPTLKWLHGEKAAAVAQHDNGANPAKSTDNQPNQGNAAPTATTNSPPSAPQTAATPPDGVAATKPSSGASTNGAAPASATVAAPPPPGLPLPPPVAGNKGSGTTAGASQAGAVPTTPPPGPGPIVGPAPANALVGGPAVVPGSATGPAPGAGATTNVAPTGPPTPSPPPANETSAPAAPTPPNPPLKQVTGNSQAASERMGRLLSEQEVLLRLRGGEGEWQRSVSPGATLGIKDRLLALPTFHPMIALSNGVTVKLMPETAVDLAGHDDSGVPIFQVEYGRVVMMTAGKPDVRIKLILGNIAGMLTFFDPDATAAVEVRDILRPGTDPHTEPANLLVALYATAGQIDWTGALGAAGESPVAAPASGLLALPSGGKLTAPARVVLAGSSDDLSGGQHELPRWYVNETTSSLDARASKYVKEALENGTSVTVGLKELVEHRMLENRSLAARSMALIDEFDPFATLLNDPDQLIVWPVEIDSLKSALARGPATADKVRAMFEKERGNDGDALYRMLWGYNKDQLQSGAAALLVDDLDNPSLDFRVLSFYNLQKILGKTHDYRPDATPANRAQAVRRWRDDLKQGLIVPRGSPPSKEEATAAKPPGVRVQTDASRGLEAPQQPIPNDRPATTTTPTPTPSLPPPPNPGQ